MTRWADRFYGAVAMYFAAGVIVTASMYHVTNGNCPWWLWPYWTLTWLWQVIVTLMA